MKKVSIAFLALFLAFTACQRVPLSNRNQLMLVNSSELLPMSFKSYREFLDTSKVDRSGSDVEMVRRVGRKIQKSVEDYLRETNNSDLIKGFQWEFNLVESKDINAFCMPGGKVVFYSGILPICKDEAGVAVVMGHEVAHAIASHGAERMSQGMLSQGILTAGQVGLGVAMSSKPQQTQQLYNSVYGMVAPAATQVGYLLPNSRRQESEADELGLTFIAKAGYDPQNAVGFWQRMAAASNGQKPPQFLSTHPADNTRIRDIKSHLPKAQKVFQASR
ncbi:M48 family metallopeptidase [Arundinibacter roseus]|uniref:M48 family peptidase n=1 Tax=Arundinibacter roseus TaxID=2070510 RepID=A0A4R4K9U8_9BACT|nr:M48 family metallopeptidase [Arundinibacter roseus]TDB64624.1 M48 family peptidase [Arundinibacter roseus]